MRYEFKYIVDKKHLQPLREMISPYVAIDEFATLGEIEGYTVRSIYFDTPDLHFYREKIEGVPNRIKLRIRGYNQPWVNRDVFFEIKRKFRIPMTKNRAKTTYNDMMAVLSEEKSVEEVFGHRGAKTQDSFNRFYFHLKSRNLKPVVLVVYDRIPYHSTLDDTIRVTFDLNLRSQGLPTMDDLYNDELDPVMKDKFILEVKFNKKYPSWMRKIVNTLSLKQCSASKYCMSIDNHNLLSDLHKYRILSQAELFTKDRA